MADHGLRVDVVPDSPAGAVTLSCAGEIDIASRGAIDDAVDRLADAGTVVVDLTGVTFMDSSGVAALLRARKVFSRNETALHVVIPEGSDVRRPLEVLRLLDVLGVVPALPG